MSEDIFDAIANETRDLLDRRYNKILRSITSTNFNPFLLLALNIAYRMSAPVDIAKNLLERKMYHGDDTAFGRMAEEKIIIGALGATVPSEKNGSDAMRRMFSPIDCEMNIVRNRGFNVH